MHPSLGALVAFCDGEARGNASRIARHVSRCEECSEHLRRIRNEKDELSVGSAMPVMDSGKGLAGVVAAMASWRGSADGAAASELRSRLRQQIGTYFGFPAITVVERPGIPAEELLGRTSELLDVFLGPAAAEAARDDILSGLAPARSEACR